MTKLKIVMQLAIAVCSIYTASSQELRMAPASQYLAENPFVVAPAFAGIGEFHQLRLTGVSQWMGVKNAPQTQSVSFDTRIADQTGLGIILYNDKNRYTSQKGGQVSYAYHLTISDYNNQFISFGLSYKFTHFSIDTEHLDGTVDPAIQPYNNFNSNFDVGALYRLENFWFSFNAVNLLDKKFKTDNTFEPQKLRNLYLYSGYVFKSDFSDVEFEPSVFYQLFESDKRSGADLNFKIRKRYDDDYIWAGVSLKTLGDQSFKANSIAPLVGFRKNSFYFAYAYEASFNRLQNNNSGTHMISLGYDFKSRRNSCNCTY